MRRRRETPAGLMSIGGHRADERPMLKSLVQLIVGVLFTSVSATVTPASLRGVIWPTLGLVACLVLLVRPAVAVVATARTSLTRNERIFIGSMDPRGIVAASTAASFPAPLVALHIGGANKLLPATFLVIAGTVTIYGLAAAPPARQLNLREPEPEPEKSPAEQPLSTIAGQHRPATARHPEKIAERQRERFSRRIEMVWIIGGGIIYLILVVTLGVMSIRKGHWVMFIIGFFLPFFWLIGALLPSRRPAY
jgi:hypothetical protein